MGVIIPKWLHIVLYFVAAGITALTYLATSGSIQVTAPVTALLGLALSIITSVDPQAVMAKATPAQLEVAAKKLLPEALARLTEYQRIKSV
jgi:hypothetical protein